VCVASARDAVTSIQNTGGKNGSRSKCARGIVGMLVAMWELGGKTRNGQDEGRREAWDHLEKRFLVHSWGHDSLCGFAGKNRFLSGALGGVKEPTFQSNVYALQ